MCWKHIIGNYVSEKHKYKEFAIKLKIKSSLSNLNVCLKYLKLSISEIAEYNNELNFLKMYNQLLVIIIEELLIQNFKAKILISI